jgi:hypothetical protein
VGVSNTVPIVFADNPLFSTGSFTLDVQVLMTRLTGNDDCIAHIHVGKMAGSSQAQPPANATTAYPSTMICLPLAWVDSSNSGKNFVRASAVKSFANYGGSSELRVGLTQNVSSSTFRYDVIVSINPWHVANFLLNPSDATTLGRVQCLAGPSPLPVSLSSTLITLPVSVSASVPLDVEILSGSSEVTVINTDADPVPVSIQGVPDVSARVQGVVDSDTPVWTSSYR